MGDFGQITIFFTMLLSALGGALILGSSKAIHEKAGQGMLLAAAASAAATLFILVYLLITHDYRIAYVHDHADRNMGIGYLVTALWGGQAGSLLFWAVLQTFYTAAVIGFAKYKPKIALGFLAALQVYFFALVLFHSNPFAPLGRIATTGLGINPLLLNPYMAVHPPTLFLGFVGFSVPVAYVFAMLLEKIDDDAWVPALRPFILFAWVFLSVGNLLGMVWAYQELGWGGYWGWDPVENASFMPWLTATALLHTATVQKAKHQFRFLNPLLMVLTFSLIVFGTFLTRSGVIQSVHAFADATVGPYLLGLIAFLVLLFAGLAVTRRRLLISKSASNTPLSKESLFVVTAWLLLLSTAFVWIGTMAPLFTELLKGEKVASTPAFFNKWMVPLGLALFAVLGLCLSVMRLRGSTAKNGMKTLSLPVGVGMVTTAAGAKLFGFAGIWPILASFLLGMSAVGALREVIRAVAAIKRPEVPFGIRRRLGAHLTHFSVVLLFLGFTGAAFTQEASKVMKPGDVLSVGDYELTFTGMREENNYRRFALFADIDVSAAGQAVDTMGTARFVYHSHPRQPTSEVAIRSTLLEDLFLILGRVNEETGEATIRAVVNPLVAWIWIGGALLVIGTIMGIYAGTGASDRGKTPVPLKTVPYYVLPILTFTIVAAVAELPEIVLMMTALFLTGSVLLFSGALTRIATSMEDS